MTKPSTLIVWLLVAACIAIDLALIGELQVRHNTWPDAGGVIGLGVSFAQIGLIALWTVWGRTNVLFRVVSALLAVWGVSYLAAYSSLDTPDEVGQWFAVLLFYCGISLVPFLVAKFAGYDLAQQCDDLAARPSGRLSANQFTIWGILSLMTATGITLAVIRFAEFPTHELLEIILFFALLAASFGTMILLCLFLKRMHIVVFAAIVICPVTGILLSRIGLAPRSGTSDLILMMILMACTQGAATLAAAGVLRIGGFRLVRPPLTNHATAQEWSAPESVDRHDGP